MSTRGSSCPLSLKDHSTCWSEDPAAGSPDTNPPERKQTDVQVYLRMRPTPEPTPLLGVRGEHKNILVARLPRKEDDLIQGVVDNSKQEHTFHFDAVFPMDTTQEKVFEVVAIPVLHNLMKGINGTIFAYGQTGTGKTFTITGGAESYNDRGIIPRALSFIFSHIKQDGLAQYSVAISYLEIYQDKGYDLLTKAQADARRIDDLQKVIASEDQDGNLVLRGLSVNTATTEEEALHLLFLGDTNRIVAETPLNDSSTRSHCTFIIWIEAREPGSSVMRKSKLHLVDLAGSERVKQSGTIPNETVFREACSINLALHYLEQVIVALHERATGRRVHVPYRNSMMTTVLRDSLGGNCQTVMIATVTPERDSMPETVSTCRFAQAVARIENQAVVNEEVDPSVLIKRLTRENEELREQLQYMKSHTAIQLRQGDDLTEEERKKCEDYVDAYIEAYSEDPEARPLLGPDVEKIRFAFKVFRDRCIQMKKGLLAPSAKYAHSGPTGTDDPPGGQHAVSFGVKSEHQCEVAKLKLHVQQRDAEIAILIDMLNRNGISPVPDSKGRPGVHGSHGFLRSFFSPTGQRRYSDALSHSGGQLNICEAPITCIQRDGEEVSHSAKPAESAEHQEIPRSLTDENGTALLLARGRAFEIFRRSVRRSSINAENKLLLKDLHARAKETGDRANAARQAVVQATEKLKQLRVSHMSTLLDATERRTSVEGEESALWKQITENRLVYEQCKKDLDEVRGQIRGLGQTMEFNKQRLQDAFEQWFHVLAQGSQIPVSAAAATSPRSAFHPDTPLRAAY